jgi:hypothetical protein
MRRNSFSTWTVSLLVGLFLCALPIARGASAPPWAAQGQPASAGGKVMLRLEDGTPVKLRLSRTISSETSQTNEQVDFELLEELRVGDVVVAPKGGVAWGTVTQAQGKRRMGRGGKLDINIDSVRLADGEKAALRGVKEIKGGGHTGAMTGAMVATSLVLWPAAPFFLFMHGKEVTIPKGTELSVYINGDMNLDPVKFGAKAANEAQPAVQTATPAGAAPVAAAASAEEVPVIFKSTPAGADISVDNKYIGSTPSTIRVPAGDHMITVEKSGYKAWKRNMTLKSGGEITVDAGLEKGQ